MSEYRDRQIAILEEHGVSYTVSRGSRHEMVEFYGKNGRRYKRQLDMTTSDRRSWRNAVSDLKRMLRDAGY